MYTDITIILDASSSMSSSAEKTRQAINEFIKTQQGQPGKCTISLWQFSSPSSILIARSDQIQSDWLKEIWSSIDVNEIKELTQGNYSPNGMTALYDAVGTVIDRVGARYTSKSEKQRPDKVLFVIMTDGGENASQSKYRDIKVLKNSIQHQESKYSWNFMFLGADFNAEEHTSAVGLDNSRVYNYDKANSDKTWRGLGHAVNSYRLASCSKLPMNFSAQIEEEVKKS